MKPHKIGRESRTKESHCTSCGKLIDAASAIDSDDRPEPGDATICLDCGHLMAFADDLTLRDLTDDEMVKVAGDERVLAIQAARAKVIPKSWAAQVQTAGDGEKWTGNGLRFETREEAMLYVDDLMYRWTSVTDTRVIHSNDAVNSRWDRFRSKAISLEQPS